MIGVFGWVVLQGHQRLADEEVPIKRTGITNFTLLDKQILRQNENNYYRVPHQHRGCFIFVIAVSIKTCFIAIATLLFFLLFTNVEEEDDGSMRLTTYVVPCFTVGFQQQTALPTFVQPTSSLLSVPHFYFHPLSHKTHMPNGLSIGRTTELEPLLDRSTASEGVGRGHDVQGAPAASSEDVRIRNLEALGRSTMREVSTTIY